MSAKKFISMMILLVALTVMSSSSFAQSMPGDKAGRVSDMLYRKLNLSDDQYAKVYSSLLGYYSSQAPSNMKDDNGMMNMTDWKNVNTSITGVLNKDQSAIYSGMTEKNITSMANYRPRKRVMKTPETSTTESKDMTKTTPPTTKTTMPPTTKTPTPPTTKDMKKGTDKK